MLEDAHMRLLRGGLCVHPERKAVGTGRTAEQAQRAVVANAQKIALTQTDMEPCPTCGLIQPDMIGQRRAQKRLQITIVGGCWFWE